MSRFPLEKLSQSGFGLTELMISLVLTGALMAGAYRFISAQTGSAGRSIENAQRDARVEPFLRKLEADIQNAIPLFSSAHGGKSTKLRVKVLENGVQTFRASGLIPIPSTELTTLVNTTNYVDDLDAVIETYHDLSDVGGIGMGEEAWWNKSNDGLRLATFGEDTEKLEVVPKSGPDGYTGFERIELRDFEDVDKLDETPLPFFRICTNLGCDIARVTNLHGASRQVSHDSDSLWNEPFDPNVSYGKDPSSLVGPTFIQKVRLLTYAYHPETKTIYVDDHTKDAFDRVPNWVPVLTNVEGFRVYVRYKDYTDALDACGDMDSDDRTDACIKAIEQNDCTKLEWKAEESRFFRPTINSSSTSCKPNTIGYPGLLRIVLEIDLLQKIDHEKKDDGTYDLSKKGRMAAVEKVTYRREFNPVNARSARPGDEDDPAGDLVDVGTVGTGSGSGTGMTITGPPGAGGGGF